MADRVKILVCGILPPPNFGHSMMYKMLMESSFVTTFDITFLDMKFWSYAKHKRITPDKIFKMVRYWLQFVGRIITKRPRYVLFNMSFDKMPFLKDYLFCVTGWALGRRIVLHDMGQYLPELHASAGPVLRVLIGQLLSITHAIIVMGEKVRVDYTPFYDPKRIVVVPGSVEDSVDVLVTVQKDKDTVEVLYFSFLSVTKGIWTALKAIPIVIKANPKVHFTFGGPIESPELHAQMDAFIKEHHLEQNVTYVGYVGDVPGRTLCYRSSDIFIFPTHRDVFGLVLLHAMAESLPVVASIEGTIPEIIEDKVNGLLFEKGNETLLARNILTLAADQALRKKMGESSRHRYLGYYAPEVYGRNMVEAFRSIDR